MPDEFGGIPVKPQTDEFGGVPVVKAPIPQGQPSKPTATIGATPRGNNILQRAGDYMGDLTNDVRKGTTLTAPGRVLAKLGAKGTDTGNSPAVGEFMASPVIGPSRVAQGLAQVASPRSGGEAWEGAKNIGGGTLQAADWPLSFVGPEASAGAIEAGGRAVKSGAKTLGRAVEPDIERGLNRVYRPSSSDSDFPNVSPSALAEVKKFGGGTGRQNSELLPRALNPQSGAEATIKTQQAALEKYMDKARAMGTRISGDDIVRATEEAIPKTVRLEDPEGTQRLIEQAKKAYGGKHFSPDEFRQYLREKNAGTSGFYNSSQTRQGVSQMAGTPAALEKAQADAIRESLYHALDPENGGAGPREIQKRTGSVMDLRAAAERRNNAILNEKPVTPIGGFLNGPVQAARKLFQGDLVGAGGALAHPFRGPSDAMLSRLYRASPEAGALPSPAEFTPRGLLERGSLRTPPPADASFVRSYPGMHAPPNPARALGPATTRFAGPVADASGAIHGAPEPPLGFRVGFPQKALPAPAPQRLLRDIGSRHGDILKRVAGEE